MTKRYILIGGRLFFGLLTLAAIITQLVSHIQHHFDVVNFFSYFTNLSNIFASVVFIIGAIFLIQRREPTPAQDLIRGASVVAMVIVFIVYGLLLRDIDLGILQPWINTIIHYIFPLVVLADWLYQPPKSMLRFAQMGYWLIYPLIYVVYTLIRGAISSFYPYPFLNPAKVGGYGVVLLYCIAIFILFLVVSWLLIILGNRLRGAIGRAA